MPEVEATAVDWITEPQAQAVKNFVEGGGVALFYHNSTYIARGNATFRAVLGAATEGHPPVRPFKVTLTDPDHPITQGASDFIVTDEQHYMTLRRRSGARFHAEHQRGWVGVQRTRHNLRGGGGLMTTVRDGSAISRQAIPLLRYGIRHT